MNPSENIFNNIRNMNTFNLNKSFYQISINQNILQIILTYTNNPEN